jgi:hypothetical protein
MIQKSDFGFAEICGFGRIGGGNVIWRLKGVRPEGRPEKAVRQTVLRLGRS